MSRKQWKLSDFDKYLKPLHLGGKQHSLTVMHVGVEPVKSRKREYVIAGDAPDEQADEFLLILHFREFGKPLRVNNMNRAKLMQVVGDDPAGLVGCKITLRVVTLKQFGGQEAIDIVSCERPKGRVPVKKEPEPEPEEGWNDPPDDENELPAEVVIAEEVSQAEQPAASEPSPEQPQRDVVNVGVTGAGIGRDAEGHATQPSKTNGNGAHKLSATDFWKYVDTSKFPKETAMKIMAAYTVGGKTDWDGAIVELRKKVEVAA